MNMIRNFFAAVAAAVLVGIAVPAVKAATVIPLSQGTAAAFDYNYKATITYRDLTNASGAIQTVTLLPASGSFPAGTEIQRVAFNLTTTFTNSAANNTNLLLYAGFDAGQTNVFFSALDVDGRSLQAGGTQYFATTNYPYVLAGATNEFQLVFKQSGGTPALATVTQGEIEVYIRAVNLNKLENE